MKITREQLKEEIRKLVREHLNSEQIFRSSEKRDQAFGISYDAEEDNEESDVVFYNRTKELTDEPEEALSK